MCECNWQIHFDKRKCPTALGTKEKVRILAQITTRDEAGVHFTRRYSTDALEVLEEAQLIEVTRPRHALTGIPFARQYWSVRVTEAGQDLIDAHPEYWPTV